MNSSPGCSSTNGQLFSPGRLLLRFTYCFYSHDRLAEHGARLEEHRARLAAQREALSQSGSRSELTLSPTINAMSRRMQRTGSVEDILRTAGKTYAEKLEQKRQMAVQEAAKEITLSPQITKAAKRIARDGSVHERQITYKRSVIRSSEQARELIKKEKEEELKEAGFTPASTAAPRSCRVRRLSAICCTSGARTRARSKRLSGRRCSRSAMQRSRARLRSRNARESWPHVYADCCLQRCRADVVVCLCVCRCDRAALRTSCWSWRRRCSTSATRRPSCTC